MLLSLYIKTIKCRSSQFIIRSSFIENSCYVSTNTKACSSTYAKKNDGDAVVVCGSPGEDANDPLTRNTFSHHECK
jgi:hypothetical protein